MHICIPKHCVFGHVVRNGSIRSLHRRKRWRQCPGIWTSKDIEVDFTTKLAKKHNGRYKKTCIFNTKASFCYCLFEGGMILLCCISIDIGGVCPEVGFAQTTARKHRFKSPNGAGEKSANDSLQYRRYIANTVQGAPFACHLERREGMWP